MGQSDEASSALEQFFSGVQMNDQLVVRMEKALHSSVADVETLARKGLLSPAQSLVYDVQQLYGLDLISDSRPVLAKAQDLLKSVQMLVSQMVEARCRLIDLVAWLRSAGSTMKAKGTAANSVQYENAKKRRVSQQVLQRIIQYFSLEVDSQHGSVTEHLIGLPISVSAAAAAECALVCF
jgi:hypothetical protein